jgi:predicted MFS family arabinose efflux permease
VLAVTILVVVPERRGAPVATGSVREQFFAVGEIFRSAYFWRLGLMLFICQAGLLSYQTLWAAPWLRDIAGLERAGVAEHMLLLQAGMLVGVLVVGVFTDRVRHIGIQPQVVLSFGLAAFLLVQLALALGIAGWAAVLWTAFGFFGGSTFLGYSLFTQHFRPDQTGRVLTTVNLMVLSTTFGMQWGIGAIIGLFAAPGPGRYSPEGHSTAYLVVLALEILGYLWFIWPRRRESAA